MKQITLTSAVIVAGKIERAGTKVEVSDEVASGLIRRGKAVESTAPAEAEAPETETDEGADGTESKPQKKKGK